MLKIMKPLAVAALLTAAVVPAHAEFGETNVEKACIILSITVPTRIEDGEWRTPVGCAKLKAQVGYSFEERNWNMCVIGIVGTHNRMRHLPDFDKPSLEIRQRIAQACLMMLKDDISEKQAEYVVKRAVKE